MATTETYTPNQIYPVPLAELQSDPNQPRKYLDPHALEELTASVIQHGILEPILFRQDPNVPKKVLIGLAKNKQQRSMITQYQKYRKAQAKAAAPNTRTTAKASPAQTMVGALETVEKKVSALDFGTFSGEDVQLMSNAMKGLQTTLKKTIARIPK